MKCPVGPASIRTKSGSSHIPPPTSAIHRLGLISDTHGLVRPEVHSALAGVDFILHAGDVGGDEILDELALIAPVHAVYGNTDEPGTARLHSPIDLTIGALRIHVSHGLAFCVAKLETLLTR